MGAVVLVGLIAFAAGSGFMDTGTVLLVLVLGRGRGAARIEASAPNSIPGCGG